MKSTFKLINMLLFMLCFAILPVQAEDLLKQLDFNEGKILPWHVSESAETNSDFELIDGEYVIHVHDGAVNKWDVQIRHRGLVIEQGHTYTVKFKVRASKATQIYAKIGTQGPPYNEYWNNNWGNITLPANEDVLIEDTFTMDQATDSLVEFAIFMGGPLTTNAPIDIAFDDFSLFDPEFPGYPEEPVLAKPDVRVNQLGYFPEGKKRATILSAATSPIEWVLKNSAGSEVASGMTTVFGLDTASEDHVHQADFSSYTTPGTDYTLCITSGTEEQASHKFDIRGDLYSEMKYDALAYFYHNRSGIAIEMPYAGREDLTRPAGHNPDLMTPWPGTSPDNYTLDLTKGWYDAGDHGKYAVNGGISVWTMMNQYERTVHIAGADGLAVADGSMNIPEQGNGYPDILDEARWQMEMLLNMQVPEGYQEAGMVHHKAHDEVWTPLAIRPDQDEETRYLRPVSTAATLNLAATAAQSARIWADLDPGFSALCLDAAIRAWDAAKANPAVYAPVHKIGGGPYNDSFVEDEFYWAACELYVTTGDEEYRGYIANSQYYLKMPTVLANGEDAGLTGVFTWGSTNGLGTLTLAMVPNELSASAVASARQNIQDAADVFLNIIETEGYLLPMAVTADGGYPWGSNSFILNEMIVMGLAYDFTGNQAYFDGVTESMDYIMGRNAMDQNYVSGYGERPLVNPHHRFWAYQADDSFPLAPAGAVSGGPNSGLEDPWATGAGLEGSAPQKCFVDHIESWSTNEITINWNAPFAWVTAFLDEEKGPVPLSVTVTSPKADASIEEGDVLVSTSVSGEAITKVDFYLNDTLQGSDSSAPFEFLLQDLTQGSYSVKAVVTAGSESAESVSVPFTITEPVLLPPVVSITEPLNGAEFDEGLDITIKADAVDADGDVVKVEFFDGTVLIDTDLTFPYEAVLKGASIGYHNLTAKATDSDGLSSESAVVTVTVKDPAQVYPEVSITAPENGDEFDEGQAISITADAADADGTVMSVEFYDGSSLISTDVEAPFTAVLEGASKGLHDLTAKATDNDGNSTVSSVITVTVKDPIIVESDLVVQYACGSPDILSQHIQGKLNIVNKGTTAVDLADLKIRYYFTVEGSAAPQFNCYYAQMGASNVNHSFGTYSDGSYVEISFGSGSLAAGAQTGEVQFAINKSDWSQFDQADDYSYDNSVTGFVDYTDVTLYRNGTKVFGTEPGGNEEIIPVVSISAPSPVEPGALVQVTASASDADGQVMVVEFFEDGVKIGEDLTAPYSITWSGSTERDYVLSAVATDNGGNVSKVSETTVTVKKIINDEWVPFYNNVADIDIAVSSTGAVSATVTFEFGSAGYRVTDWGLVARGGNTFAVDAKVEAWTGYSATVMTSIDHTYDLGTLEDGTYSFEVSTWGNPCNSKTFIVDTNPVGILIPGAFEAEDYDDFSDSTPGNTGGAYRNDDVDIEECGEGGYNVGWISDNEYLAYNVNVTEAGLYDIELRVAREPAGDGSLHIEMDGQDVSGPIAISSTNGWQSYETVIKTGVNLSQGAQVLKIVMDRAPFNLNSVNIKPSNVVLYPLTIALASNTADVQTVTLTPAPTSSGPAVISGTDGYSQTVYYDGPTSISLSASSNDQVEFTFWSGALSGSVNPASYTLSSSASITANFQEVIPTSIPLTVRINGTGSVTLSPAPTKGGSSVITSTTTVYYTDPVNVSLTGSGQFNYWSGDVSGNSNPAVISLAGYKSYSVSAYFSGGPVTGDWLHTDGNKIVDANGNPVWLTGANWFGFNTGSNAFDGLWSCNLEEALTAMADRGINILRIPISSQLLNEWQNGIYPMAASVNDYVNPDLKGKNSLEIFDATVAHCEKIGLKILIDVHSPGSDAMGHIDPLWYKGDITPEIFISSWIWFAERYKDNDTIIAYDLENEPHGKAWQDEGYARWDDSDHVNNWKKTAEDCGNAILAVNPNALILVEGIESYPVEGKDYSSTNEDDYYGNWWGGNLRGVKDHPVDLGANQDQLVYSPHDYGPKVWEQEWFKKDFTMQSLYEDCWGPNWAYIMEDDIAPLLIGEWGGFMDGDTNQKWMELLRDYIGQNYIHHTFWCFNANSGDTGGLVDHDFKTWDEEKYALLKPVLWQDNSGNFVGLDHDTPLGSNGITVTEYYLNGNTPPAR